MARTEARRLVLAPPHGAASRHGGFCQGCRDLLAGIDRLGSLNASVKHMGMAYSKAWSLVAEVESDFGRALIVRKGANGSELTAFGRTMVEEYDAAIAAARDALRSGKED